MPAGESRLFRTVPGVYSLALAAVVFGPLFGPGYLLLRDAVSTPRSYLTDSALGLGDAAPRAVPQDGVLAVASTIVDGGIVVKVILFASLWLAGWGAAAMVRAVLDLGLGPQLVAATVVIWNPYVAERLLQGHWSLLAGYAALPWTVCAAASIRAGGGRRAWCALAVCLAAAGLTPTGALLATVVAIALVRGRRLAGVGVLALVASAPWLTAAWLSGTGTSDTAGIAAFAARAEPGLGTLGSLAGLGGIWNSTAVPDSRTGLFALVGTALLLGVVCIGLPALWRRRDPVISALIVLGALAILIPALGATSWGIDAGEWAVDHVPGTGLLRDTQKWVALAVPLYALAAAAGGYAARAHFAGPWTCKVRTGGVAALLLIALPDLAWGVGGALKPVTYPASWQRVADALDASDESGDVAVLPAGMFRIFPYSGAAPVLDPAPRMLPKDVLQTGELLVRGERSDGGSNTAGGRVGGEGSRAEKVETLLLAGGSAGELAEQNVRWVLVEQTSAGPLGESQSTLEQLNEVYSGDQLTLYRVAGDVDDDPADGRAIMIAAHLLWAALLAGGLLSQILGRARPDQP